jgi:thiol-disulfide isomerase/thioredoxin
MALPEFTLRDLQQHNVSSADLRGKVVLIDFWGTWWQPCKKEMPGYQRLLDRYGPKGFVVIGMKVDVMRDTAPPLRLLESLACVIRWWLLPMI